MIIKTKESKLLCPICRTYVTIQRNQARQKREGHYKKLYCYVCKETHNFIELNRSYTNNEIELLIKHMSFEKSIKELLK